MTARLRKRIGGPTYPNEVSNHKLRRQVRGLSRLHIGHIRVILGDPLPCMRWTEPVCSPAPPTNGSASCSLHSRGRGSRPNQAAGSVMRRRKRQFAWLWLTARSARIPGVAVPPKPRLSREIRETLVVVIALATIAAGLTLQFTPGSPIDWTRASTAQMLLLLALLIAPAGTLALRRVERSSARRRPRSTRRTAPSDESSHPLERSARHHAADHATPAPHHRRGSVTRRPVRTPRG